jgi:leucine-rich repeat protein SHOC2
MAKKKIKQDHEERKWTQLLLVYKKRKISKIKLKKEPLEYDLENLEHQGSIYEETIEAIPSIWINICYHLDLKQYDSARTLLKFLKKIYDSFDFPVEPFGLDMDYVMKKYPNDLVSQGLIRELFKEWDLVLAFFKSGFSWLKIFAIFFIRHNLERAKESVSLLRNQIAVETKKPILIAMLRALILIDSYIDDNRDLPLLYAYLHPDLPKDIRITAMFGIFILKKGNISDTMLKVVLEHYNNIMEEGFESADPSSLDLSELYLDLPKDKEIDPIVLSTIQRLGDSLTEKLSLIPFYNLVETKNFLYFVNPGANKGLFPILLEMVDKIPDNFVKPVLALKNLIETLISGLFPEGFISYLKNVDTIEKLHKIFLTKILNVKLWKEPIICGILDQYGFGQSLMEFIKKIDKFESLKKFQSISLLTLLESVFQVKYKLNPQNEVYELKINEEHSRRDSEYLTISGENKKGILDRIGNFQTLKKLEFDFDNSSYLPDCFLNLKELEFLDISLDEIAVIPPSLFGLKSVKSLGLHLNSMRIFPKFINSFPNLTSLNLRIDHTEEFPVDLKQLTKLEQLKLYFKDLDYIPVIFPNLIKLKTLELILPNVETIPEFSLKQIDLQSIIIKGCKKLKTLPNSLCNLPSLKKLHIQMIKSFSLPEGIGNLQSLEELYLVNLGLKELPLSIGNLHNLLSLEITANPLNHLPSTFCKLSKLRSLSIINCQLSELPESFGSLQNLTSLKITGNPLDHLPSTFCKLSKLRSLSINNCQLSELPESFGSLQNLTSLVITSNPLDYLPSTMQKLTDLQFLHIEHCQLSNIPEWIGKLTSLEEISFSNNNITTIPIEIIDLPKLDKLAIKKNNLNSFPPKLYFLKEFWYDDSNFFKDHTKKINILKEIIKFKTDTIKKIYKHQPQAWQQIFKDDNITKNGKNLFLNGSHNGTLLSDTAFTTTAQFFMLKGIELLNYQMIYKAMDCFAILLESNSTLYQYFVNNKLFQEAQNLLETNSLKAESFLEILSKLQTLDGHEPEFENNFINELNDRAWFYLKLKFNMQFCLAIGQFIQNYGIQNQSQEWEYYGKDIIASSYAITHNQEFLQKAVSMFKEIKDVNPDWHTPEMYDLAQLKLSCFK